MKRKAMKKPLSNDFILASRYTEHNSVTLPFSNPAGSVPASSGRSNHRIACQRHPVHRHHFPRNSPVAQEGSLLERESYQALFPLAVENVYHPEKATGFQAKFSYRPHSVTTQWTSSTLPPANNDIKLVKRKIMASSSITGSSASNTASEDGSLWKVTQRSGTIPQSAQ
jgi:hypothetical protein